MKKHLSTITFIGLSLVLLIAAAGALLYRGAGGEIPPAPSLEAQGPFSHYEVVTGTGDTLALGLGEYLVAMLSMSCDHCMASVPQLNEYVAQFPDIPVVALCWEPSDGAMAEFAAISGPVFPMHSLGNNFLEFAALIGSAPPRLSFVRDGFAVQSWDDAMPDRETLLAVFTPSRSP